MPMLSVLRSSVVAPFDHAKVNGVMPPLAVKLILPLAAPLHVILVEVLDKTRAVGSVIEND